MKHRLLLATLLLPCCVQAEPVGPQPIEMPDIRANIIRSLQQGRHEGMEVGEESYRNASVPDEAQAAPASTTPDVPAGEEDLFSLANERKRGEGGDDTATPAKPVPRDDKPEEPHLYLPSKEITIRSRDDMEKLLQEFEAAKKRQSPR